MVHVKHVVLYAEFRENLSVRVVEIFAYNFKNNKKRTRRYVIMTSGSKNNKSKKAPGSVSRSRG